MRKETGETGSHAVQLMEGEEVEKASFSNFSLENDCKLFCLCPMHACSRRSRYNQKVNKATRNIWEEWWWLPAATAHPYSIKSWSNIQLGECNETRTPPSNLIRTLHHTHFFTPWVPKVDYILIHWFNHFCTTSRTSTSCRITVVMLRVVYLHWYCHCHFSYCRGRCISCPTV